MTSRRALPAAVCLFVTGCAGAVCFVGGLVSAVDHRQIWLTAAVSTAVALIASLAVALLADCSISRKQEHQLVHSIENWMREGAPHGDGHRQD